MTMTTRSLLLGSIFLCGVGFTACSDDSTDDTGAGGTGSGGTGAGGKATGNGGAARGGAAGVGGVANGGTSTGGIGTVANAGAAGAVALGTGGAVGGAPGTGGAAGTPVATGGAATGGKATGGAPMAGAAGTSVATGGAAAGAAGTPIATGGATAGAAGALGAGGAAAGSAGAAGAAGAAFTKIWSFETVDGWGIKSSTGEVTRIDASAGTTLATGLTPGIATWTVPFVAAANTAITQTGLENNFTAVDMTGKTITLNIRWVSGGIGVAAAATGGFDVYIVANDADLTEGASSYVGALALADRGAAAFKSFTYTVPAAAAPWEPSAVRQLNIRLDSRYWTADPQPVFDYTTAVFEIDSVTY